MKKLKKIGISVLVMVIAFYGFKGINYLMRDSAKKTLCKKLEELTGDKFRFIYGLDREWSIATNVRYRGIIYSDKLEKIKWPDGFEISLEDLDINNSNTWQMANDYIGFLQTVKVERTVESEAIKIFGAKTNLYNDGSTTDYMYDVMINKRGQNIPFEKKSSYYSTIINVFVDDLDRLNNDEIKQKTFELAKFIYNEMNYTTALQVYVRDDEYFGNYDLVYYSIYKPFRGREDIKAILGNIKNKKKLTEEEKVELVRVFNKDLDYKIADSKCFQIFFTKRTEIPIDKKNVKFTLELKNRQLIYQEKIGG